jgi:hypothetical protein
LYNAIFEKKKKQIHFCRKRKRQVTAEEEHVIEHFPAGSFCFIVAINSRDGKGNSPEYISLTKENIEKIHTFI